MTARPGKLAKVGLALSSTWGTPVVVGANDQLLLTSETLTSSRTRALLPDVSIGGGYPDCAEYGEELVPGPLGDAFFKYDGNIPRIIAAVMGDDVPVIVGGGPEYDHTMEWQTTIKGIMWTLVADKNTDFIEEVPSVKITDFSLAGTKMAQSVISTAATGNVVNVNTDSTVNREAVVGNNTPTTAAAITEAANECTMAVVNEDTVLEIAPFNGSLAPIRVTDFTLAVQRVVAGVSEVNVDSPGISEPLASDTDFAATLAINQDVNDADSQDLMESMRTFTDYFGKLTMLGRIVNPPGGSLRYRLEVEFHKMMVNVANASLAGVGKIPAAISFDLFEDTTTTHTGLRAAGPKGPCAIYLRNQNASDLLS